MSSATLRAFSLEVSRFSNFVVAACLGKPMPGLLDASAALAPSCLLGLQCCFELLQLVVGLTRTGLSFDVTKASRPADTETSMDQSPALHLLVVSQLLRREPCSLTLSASLSSCCLGSNNPNGKWIQVHYNYKPQLPKTL